jgi:3-oxoadipate enol-lactonase
MPIIRVNDCDIYYEVTGSGPDLVFVHGEDHGIELFADQIPFFSQRYRCISYYRRGHGLSELPPYGYSLNNQVIDFERLLKHIGIQRCTIVAVAMATPIAATFALRNPDGVQALALVSWYELDGYPLLEERRKSKHPMTFGKFHMLEYEVLRNGGAQALREWFKKEGDALIPILPVEPSVRDRVIKMIASHTPEHFIKAAEYYTSLPNLTPQLRTLKCPILGICGVDDPSPDYPDLLTGASNFRQVWIPNARRFSMIEAPEEFNRVLLAFLDASGG